MQQLLLGVGAKKSSVYLDDIFSTFVYEGNGYHSTLNPSGATSRDIVNGIDFTEGGLAIFKRRETASWWQWVDTVNGATNSLASNSSNALDTNRPNGLKTFNNNGVTIGYDGLYNFGGSTVNWNNAVAGEYVLTSLRKSTGFLDIVEFTETGSVGTDVTVSHSLGSVPGMILIKTTSRTSDWFTYHRETGASKYLALNGTMAAGTVSSGSWGPVTSTSFNFNSQVFGYGQGTEWIAYVFAGGESDAATARSVHFSGTQSTRLTIPDSDDFDLGSTFTIETWVKPDYSSNNGYYEFFNHGNLRLYVRDYNDGVFDCGSALGGDLRSSKGSVPEGQWTHVALVVNSGIAKLYVNGVNDQNANRTGINLSGTGQASIGAANNAYFLEGNLSNLRIVKGTAVYTSSFRPPTEPLTNITNTVLLCCNDSSVTGSTVTPNTITKNDSTTAGNAQGLITASSDSPFDDPAGFVFGESGSENVIKCGSYVGSGTAGLEVNVGFEPQWIMFKNASATYNWYVLDVMRGIVSGGDDAILSANTSSAEFDSSYIDVTPTGFKVQTSHALANGSGSTYIFTAIRRSDGYCGKPPELGTAAFGLARGAGNPSFPCFVTGFPVDFLLQREFASASAWTTGARLTGAEYMYTNTTDAGADTNYDWGSNTGAVLDRNSDWQGWLWKRGAGMDVLCYEGTGSTQVLSHSLGKNVEMAWIKRRDGTADWKVYHSGLDSSNPENYNLTLNSVGVRDYSTTRFGAPSSTHFTVKTHATTNGSGNSYLMMLFASTDVSKVGSYSGNGSTGQTISTGFAPRFVIIRKYNDAANWLVLDTTRGWGSGDDKYILLNSSGAQGDYEVGAPVSNGFTLVGDNDYNNSSGSYIYYAHA